MDGVSKFAYRMIFNGYTPTADLSSGKVSMIMNDHTVQQVDVTPEMEQGIADLNMRIARRNAHTDFWGEYTLAK